jgi:hypothetical protein
MNTATIGQLEVSGTPINDAGNQATINVHHLCDWTEDPDDGLWYTGCGETFCFIDGTPHDNGFRYCCFCGKTLLQNTPDQTL